MRETADAVTAFEQYYDMEDRSLVKLAQEMHQKQSKSSPITILSHLKRWSVAHEWQRRIIERERAIAEKERKRRQKEIEKMNDEHAMLGQNQALRAVKQIQELIDAKKFGSQAAVQLLKVSTDLERVARGASTEQIALTGRDGGPIEMHSDTDDLTEDDLQFVVEMAARLRAQRGDDVDSAG